MFAKQQNYAQHAAPYLPTVRKKDIAPILFNESQINTVCRDFYFDDEGTIHVDEPTINLWTLYNLLISANKSSYIDSFLERSVNAYDFTGQIRHALENKSTSWYLN